MPSPPLAPLDAAHVISPPAPSTAALLYSSNGGAGRLISGGTSSGTLMFISSGSAYLRPSRPVASAGSSCLEAVKLRDSPGLFSEEQPLNNNNPADSQSRNFFILLNIIPKNAIRQKRDETEGRPTEKFISSRFAAARPSYPYGRQRQSPSVRSWIAATHERHGGQ